MMKLFSLILGVFLLMTSTAFGAITFTDSSDVFVGNFHRVKCGAEMSCTKDNTNRLLLEESGIQTQVASTTTTLTAAQCGSTIVGAGAHTLTLPEASTVLGCRFTFIGGTVDDVAVNPADGTDQIGPVNYIAAGTSAALAPAAGDAIQMTDIGSSIVLEAVGADLWAVVGTANGAWADID